MATKSMWRWLSVMGAAVFALAIAASAFAQVPLVPHTFYGGVGSAMLDGAAAADGAVVTATNQDGEAVGAVSVGMDGWAIEINPADAASVTFSINGSDPSGSYDVEPAGFTEVSLDLTSPAPEEPVDEVEEPVDEVEEPVDEVEEPVDEVEEPVDEVDDADDMGDTDDADDMGDTDDADDMGDTDDDMGDDDMGDGDDADDMGDEPMALPDTGSGGLAGGSSLPVLPLALAISIVVALGGVMAVRRTRA